MTTNETPEGFIQSLNQAEIDFVILADRVEAVNGKVYMMGGAYDRLFLDPIPATVLLSWVVGILVPWNATNQENRIDFAVESGDGDRTFFKAGATFNVGRAPVMSQGDTQRVLIAPPALEVTIPEYGTYCLRVTLNSGQTKIVPFYASNPRRSGMEIPPGGMRMKQEPPSD